MYRKNKCVFYQKKSTKKLMKWTTIRNSQDLHQFNRKKCFLIVLCKSCEYAEVEKGSTSLFVPDGLFFLLPESLNRLRQCALCRCRFNVNIFCPARRPNAIRQTQTADCSGAKAVAISISTRQIMPSSSMSAPCRINTLINKGILP